VTPATHPARASWRVLLLAALTVVLALLLPAVPASAAALPAAETRVGASGPATAVVVGVHECITAGQRPVRGPSQPQIAVGNCVAAEAGGAANAANGLRLGQQLARESAESAFTKSGALQAEVVQNSSRIIPGSNIGNPSVVKGLTADGSNIADWGKYTSQTFQSPSGPFQVHYYFNPATGRVNYNQDYKVVFNGAR
jgi:hypothetical protein